MKYFGKKLITLIMTLFLVSVAAFLAFQIIPGDVVTSILGTEATPEREEQLREELGLNDPPAVRYFHWIAGVLQGDLGVSYRYSKNMNEMMPVAELIGDKLPVTLCLAAVSLVFIIVVSIPLGVLWAGLSDAAHVRPGGVSGRTGGASGNIGDAPGLTGAVSGSTAGAAGLEGAVSGSTVGAAGLEGTVSGSTVGAAGLTEDAFGSAPELIGDASGNGNSKSGGSGNTGRISGRTGDMLGWAGHVLDAALGVITQATMAVPSFFLGILVTYVLGIVLGLFAPGGYVSYQEDFGGFLAYLIFPALSIAIPKIAMTARFLRNSMLTELSADYVRTAYSKGASKRRVMYGHVLRNAMMPVVTFLGMIVAEIVAGSIVIEQVFGLPGIGRLLISSISTRDFPVVEILILYITFVVIFVYFLVDILYRVIDPRISGT